MNPLLVGSLAATGLAVGWGQRAVIVRCAVPSDEPPCRCCPACGQQLLTVREMARAPLARCAACWLALCSVPLAFVDAAVRRLPDVLTGAAFAGTALLLLAAAAAGGHWHVLVQAVLGGVALAGFCLVLAAISPPGMGTGDVKAAAVLGIMLAWRGWSALIAGGFAGFLFTAVYGIALLLSGRATGKHQLPFGPFMIVRAFLVLLAWRRF